MSRATNLAKPQPVASTGTQTGGAFVTRESGCGVEVVTTPTYPKSIRAEGLRELRVALDLTLREGADALGLTPSEISGVQQGRLAYTTQEQWKAAAVALIKAAAKKAGVPLEKPKP